MEQENNPALVKPSPFLDARKDEVNVGDFILYPINTFFRYGVVKKVIDSKSLNAMYSLIYAYYNPDGVNALDMSDKTQLVHIHHRSVLKISAEELQRSVHDMEFRRLQYLQDKILSKANKAKQKEQKKIVTYEED